MLTFGANSFCAVSLCRSKIVSSSSIIRLIENVTDKRLYVYYNVGLEDVSHGHSFLAQ